MSRLTHVVGFDDAPFARSHRGDVLVVGAVFAASRLEGVVSTRVRRDGANSTDRLIDCLGSSRFFPQLHAVLLQGIAFAGFNVIDLRRLHAETGLPVLVVARHAPDLGAIRAGSFTGDGEQNILCLAPDAFAVVRLSGERLVLDEFAAYRSDSEDRLEHEMEVGDVNATFLPFRSAGVLTALSAGTMISIS